MIEILYENLSDEQKELLDAAEAVMKTAYNPWMRSISPHLSH